MGTRLTTKDFIERAKKVHGDLYDYSKVVYVNTDTKVCIIDPKYGEFWQTPHHHISRKQGNPARSKVKKRTTEEFIQLAKKVHGDFYDYSKVKYINNNTKVCIIDPEYGDFWQTPANHLRGSHSMARSGTPKKTKEQFIKDAREVHGNKYDYSKVEYKGTNTKVLIIDPVHGEFWQEPSNHLQGNEHPARKYEKIAKALTKSTEDFIKEAREVHGNLYDYSKVKYKGNKYDVCIIDPKFGEFWQTPGNHLSGKGCPARSTIGFNPTKPGILYYIRIMDGRAYKIGITNKSVRERFRNDMPLIDIIKTWYYEDGYEAQREEKRIIHEYRHAKYDGVPLLENAQTSEMFRYDVLCLDDGEMRTRVDPEPKSRYRYNSISFIERAKEIHGDTYDYSKVDYINNRTKVCIIDPEYGEFWQAPSHHLMGMGNPKRSGRFLSTKDFIKKAKEVYGDFYDYTKVDYKKSKEKVLIIDPEYGEFWQTPHDHLKGKHHEKRSRVNRRLDTKEFIRRAKEVHGEKYDYSKVVYVKSNAKVTIIDPEYSNEFDITPANHLYGKGNPVRANNKRKTTEQFIKDARAVHGDLYDYSKTKYVNAITKVTIIDPVYGEFQVKPTNHISQGNGHPLRAIETRRAKLSGVKKNHSKQAKLDFGDDFN